MDANEPAAPEPSPAADNADNAPEAAPSLRETLEAAFDASEKTPAEPAVGAPASSASAGRDEKGRFATTAAGAAKPAAAPETQPADKGLTAGAPTPLAPAPPAEDKPPQSWSPQAREHWAAIPEAARVQIRKREADIMAGMQRNAEAAKGYEEIGRVLAPHAERIRALGHQPAQAVEALLRVDHELRTADPKTRAGRVASIVRQYGVDIGELDAALAGGPGAAQLDPAALAQQTTRAVLAQLNQHAQQQQQQHMRAEVDEFGAKAEFFERVRTSMGEIMHLRAQAGVDMTLQQAYELACQLDPEIKGVLEQREAAKRATAPSGSAARAKAASSSVRTSPGGTPPAGEPKSVRSAIEAAMKQG